MVGTNVKGKCSDCGGWFWEIEKDGNGRFIPDRDETGQIIYSQYNNKPTYTQHRHVHECKGPNMSARAASFEKRLNTTQESVIEDSALNQKNQWSIAADLAVIRERLGRIESEQQAYNKVLDKVAMDIQTFLRHAARNGSFITKANDLVKDKDNNDNGSSLQDELSNDDDTTPLDSHSINFVDDTGTAVDTK